MTKHRPTICQVLHGLAVGGAEVLAARLARQLAHRLRFRFICLDELGTLGEQLRDEGFPVSVLGRRAGVDLKCMWRLAKLLRRERPDLIHAHQYTPFFYSITARLLYRRPPVLFTEHGRWLPDYPRRKRILANRLLLEKRDRVVGVGENVRQALIDNEGIPPERVSVIYNGIDLSPFAHASDSLAPSSHSPASSPLHSSPSGAGGEGTGVRGDVSAQGNNKVGISLVGHALRGMPEPIQNDTSSTNGRLSTREEMMVGPDDLVIVHVARLDALKDHPTAIRAFAHVVCSRPNAHLVLVGDGPELPNIQRLVREMRLESHVRFLGTRRDVPRLLHASDLFLLSSKSEGIPLTIIEAMAAGLPVVSTNVGGISEIINDGETGLLAPAGDAEKLAACILRLVRNPELGTRMATLGRQRASTLFSEARMHGAYLRLYEEMIGHG